MTAACLARPSVRPAGGTGWFAATVAATGLAVGLQVALGTNSDTSWLIGVAERTLDGAVPYRDILETNPPASFLIEVPAVLLARVLRVSAEAVTTALVLLAAPLGTALSGWILDRARLLDRARMPAMVFAGALVLLVLPISSFAQREHVAVLASLPVLAALAARVAGRPPCLALATLAGLGAGVAISIKPVFALAFVGPWVMGATRGSWRSLASAAELWVAGSVTLGYGVVVASCYPDFATRMLPLLAVVYVPARLDVAQLLTTPASLLWLVLMALFALMAWITASRAPGTERDPGLRIGADGPAGTPAMAAWLPSVSAEPLIWTLLMASAGFQASVIVQGKGFTYHGYPAVATAALACTEAILRATAKPSGRSPGTAAIAVPTVATMLLGLFVFDQHVDIDAKAPGLVGAILDVAPHPKLLTIGADMSFGRPFAREIGGDAEGSSPLAWVTTYAAAITRDPERDRRFAEPIRMEREQLAADIVRTRPDVVLIDGEGWKRWADRDPALAEALGGYRRIGRFGEQILLARRAQDDRPDRHDGATGSPRDGLQRETAVR